MVHAETRLSYRRSRKPAGNELEMQHFCLQRLSRDPFAGLQNTDVLVLTAERVAARFIDFCVFLPEQT